jgi:hypothetical protein
MNAFEGRSYPMTVITPIAPLQRLRLCLTLRVFKILRWIHRSPTLSNLYAKSWLGGKRHKKPFEDLQDLKFIHFARWTLATKKHFGEALRDRYLIFSTNFNGDWHQYLDAFSFTLSKGLNCIWGTSRDYPGAWPVTPFKAYARRHMLPAGYYYNAYPGASVRDIASAKELTTNLAEFRKKVASVTSPQEFREQYHLFLASVQGYLGSASVGAPAARRERAYR